MSILKYKTKSFINTGNPILKYADNFIFWNDFQKIDIDFTTNNAVFFNSCSSDSSDLSIILKEDITQSWINYYKLTYEGLVLLINNEIRYIKDFQIGKILLDSPLSIAVTNTSVYYKYLSSIKNKVTGNFQSNGSDSAGSLVINNKLYNKKGYSIRTNGPMLPAYLYPIPPQFSLITKFQFITDQSSNWTNPPGGDSGNGGIPTNKVTDLNYSIHSTGITTIQFDSQTLNNYSTLQTPVNLYNFPASKKFLAKVVEKDSQGYKFYVQNQKYYNSGSNQGTIIDTSIHPYLQFSFYQYNGNPGGRFQEFSYMFILGNATQLNEKELNRFISFLEINYNK